MLYNYHFSKKGQSLDLLVYLGPLCARRCRPTTVMCFRESSVWMLTRRRSGRPLWYRCSTVLSDLSVYCLYYYCFFCWRWMIILFSIVMLNKNQYITFVEYKCFPCMINRSRWECDNRIGQISTNFCGLLVSHSWTKSSMKRGMFW